MGFINRLFRKKSVKKRKQKPVTTGIGYMGFKGYKKLYIGKSLYGLPVFNYYRCTSCGYECRWNDWPKNGRHCPACTLYALEVVPEFKIRHRWMEEVTDMICETCEIPLRKTNSEVYCPYCTVHNPYELYVKGDDSEPVIARKVNVADELRDAIIGTGE